MVLVKKREPIMIAEEPARNEDTDQNATAKDNLACPYHCRLKFDKSARIREATLKSTFLTYLFWDEKFFKTVYVDP